MNSEPTWSVDDEPTPASRPEASPAPTVEAPTVAPSWLPPSPEGEIESVDAATTVRTPELEGTDAATTTYDLDVTQSGRYELWARVRVERSPSSPVWSDGTVAVSIDDGRRRSFSVADGDWCWLPLPAGPLAVRPDELSLADGAHSVSVVTHRETAVSELRLLERSPDRDTDGSPAVCDRPFVMTDS